MAAVRSGSREALQDWLVRTADRWMEEAIDDIRDGLDQAERLEPAQRHFRGVLAMAQLDYVAQQWGRADWRVTREQMLDELADSWLALLGDH